MPKYRISWIQIEEVKTQHTAELEADNEEHAKELLFDREDDSCMVSSDEYEREPTEVRQFTVSQVDN
jgi:hypothetical protein